ncbi:MAG TPA: hypothetical protein DCY13_08465 [Verrucomicrobiales bacterium]|nr:hypothetical protein [Verrucomicrobiales bacterium]
MRHLKPILLTAIVLGGLSLFPVAAPAAELSGLDVGAKAPAFALKNQDGAEVKLADLLKQGPVALVFFRSADW